MNLGMKFEVNNVNEPLHSYISPSSMAVTVIQDANPSFSYSGSASSSSGS